MRIVALDGDRLTTPASTIESMWSALGAGAGGLCLSLAETSDKVVVCTPALAVLDMDGKPVNVSELTYAELREIDAGFHFQSTELDEDGEPTGNKGTGNPWAGLVQEWPLKDRTALNYPKLEFVLQQLGRRTSIAVLFDATTLAGDVIVAHTAELLSRFGLAGKVALAASEEVLASLVAATHKTTLDARHNFSCSTLVGVASKLGCSAILAFIEDLQGLDDVDRQKLLADAKNAGLVWQLASQTREFVPGRTASGFAASLGSDVDALLVGGVLPAKYQLAPAAVILQESFAGSEFNEEQWRAGYSSLNQQVIEAKIEVNDGLVISLVTGQRYAGAAAATAIPIHGDFDSMVDFHVAAPNQATTFELAAIGIDPGYHHINNEDLGSRKVNLTFDVHGAPPYASSERDQNDGFRCGWNNSANLTRVSESWEARSVNMYNKYGRDVGDGSNNSLSGTLRLVRHGSVFNSYYKDKHNPAWVCSGTMLVSNLPIDSFIRLAAKHWDKNRKPPPANTVTFRNFVLRQQ